MTTFWKPLLFLLLSAGISVAFAWSIQSSTIAGLADFKAIYYGGRCVLQQQDPYNRSDFLKVYQDSGGGFPPDPWTNVRFRQIVPICINLPTSLFFAAPFALLPWGPAHFLWFILEAGSMFFAAYLTLDIAGKGAPGVSVLLVCFVLANSEVLIASGNLVAIVAGASVGAVWCIERGRLIWLGTSLLALALALKPHDAGFIWLYLLFSSGRTRKIAVLSLGLTLCLGLLSVNWIWHASPRWPAELRSNLVLTSEPGGLNDPGPTSLTGNSPGMIIDMQSLVSEFSNDRVFPNLASYLVCGSFLLVWLVSTIRARGAKLYWHFGLAAIIPLSLLITYHRVYDAKLLLLTIPAFAALWNEVGVLKWLALLVNAVTFLLCGDITLSLLLVVESKLHLALTGWTGTLLKVLMERPIPLALLVMAIFYLVVYVRRVGSLDIQPVAPAAS